MSNYVLHHKGAYNLYSPISDAPIFSKAITLEQLKKHIGDEQGKAGLRYLPERLERAHAKGTSEINSTLDDTIFCNRAGDNESHLSKKEFIRRFLSLENKPATDPPQKRGKK